MKKSFYYVDADYIQYLKEAEIIARGFTTVPNVEYANHNKFVYGVILEVNGINYYVPISSYKKSQEDNILIKIEDHKKMIVRGSMRFNFMIPVPKRCLVPVDFNAPYRPVHPTTNKIIFLSCEGSATEEEYVVLLSEIYGEVKSKISTACKNVKKYFT